MPPNIPVPTLSPHLPGICRHIGDPSWHKEGIMRGWCRCGLLVSWPRYHGWHRDSQEGSRLQTLSCRRGRDIIAIQITRVRAKYFYAAPCEDVAAWASGPPPPDTAQTLQQQQQQQQQRRWCAAAAGPNISQGSRYSADHCRADGRLVSSLAVQSRIMYNIWRLGCTSYLHLSPASAG